jgi:glycosyltransferase involved in cell wall biosynthesis
MPFFTVVVAAYNAEHWLGATLSSVLGQDFADFELIVVNDGSRDHTSDISQGTGDPRVRVINSENRGVSCARNLGLSQSAAPNVVFLDADDLLEPGALAIMAQALDNNPLAPACFGKHVKIDANGNELVSRDRVIKRPFPTSDTLWHLLARNFIVNGGALAARTECVRRVGGYDPSLRFAEDWELWCRLACLGDFHTLNESILLKYRRLEVSANFRLREGVSLPGASATEKVFQNEAIRSRFSAKELNERRRLLEMDILWSGARNAIYSGRYLNFAQLAAQGLFLYPDSVPRYVRLLSGRPVPKPRMSRS